LNGGVAPERLLAAQAFRNLAAVCILPALGARVVHGLRPGVVEIIVPFPNYDGTDSRARVTPAPVARSARP